MRCARARLQQHTAAVPDLKSDGSVLARLTRNHYRTGRPEQRNERRAPETRGRVPTCTPAAGAHCLARSSAVAAGGGTRTSPTNERARAGGHRSARYYVRLVWSVERAPPVSVLPIRTRLRARRPSLLVVAHAGDHERVLLTVHSSSPHAP